MNYIYVYINADIIVMIIV